MCYLYHFLFYLPSRIFNKYFYYFLLLGIICKVLLSFSKPLWEDDWSRYLWEGNLLGYGISPYTNSPDLFFKEGSLTNWVEKEAEILSRINHPDWGSIYSPVVLLYFYLCSLVAPFSLIILKLGFIGMDVVVFWIIKSIRNKKNAVLFFLFPVLLKEIYISGHFEMIPIFFFSISIWFHKKSYKNISSFFYGIAVHSKLYLFFVLPFFLIRNSLKNLVLSGYSFIQFFAFFFLGIFLPLGGIELLANNNSFYGLDLLLKFGNEFEFNSLYFYILKILFNFGIAKKIVFLVITALVFFLIFNYKDYLLDLNQGLSWMFYLFLFILLFSPIVNPWYFLILLPLYFIVKPTPLYIWILLLIPQMAYLTEVNIGKHKNSYTGFYNIEDSIIYVEIISFTIVFIYHLYKKRRFN
jgi:hypothetical protein